MTQKNTRKRHVRASHNRPDSPHPVVRIALTAPIYAFGGRRLLGLRLPLCPSQVVGSE